MDKLIRRTDDGRYSFWCPGCKEAHIFNDKWTLTNLVKDRPTVSPSLLTRWTYLPPEPWTFENNKVKGAKDMVCHLFIRDGNLQFLSDSTHELAGKTVPMIKF